MPLTEEQKEQIIDDLIANEGLDFAGAWNEEDREALEAIPEEKLIALNEQRELLVNAMTYPGDMDNDEEEQTPPPKKKKKKTPAANTQDPPITNKKPETTEEWMAAAPPEVQSVVRNAMQQEKQRKAVLVKKITANENNKFTKEYLNTLDEQVLQGMAALAANQEEEQPMQIFAPNFSGVAGSPINNVEDDFGSQDSDMDERPFDYGQKQA